MPRYPRVLSKSQIYHVMLRGNERKNIFQDGEDKERFIETLHEKKKTGEFLLYAYCVMDTHVHLVICEKNDSISRIMKRIAVSYAYYYNNKNKRVGHVFQDRFKSENIENETYLLSAVRYVHKNPVKAGLCSAEAYKWSSMSLYLNFEAGLKKLPEIKNVLELFNKDNAIAIKRFLEFSSQSGKDLFLDLEEETDCVIDEEKVTDFISKYLLKHKISLEDIKKKENIEFRDQLLRELSRFSGFSSRKISELTGINRETTRKVLLSREPSP